MNTRLVTIKPTINIAHELYGTHVQAVSARLKTRKITPGCACLQLGVDGVYRISVIGPDREFCNIKAPLWIRLQSVSQQISNRLARWSTGKMVLCQPKNGIMQPSKTASHPFSIYDLLVKVLGGTGKLAVIGVCAGLFVMGAIEAQRKIGAVDWQMIGQALRGEHQDAALPQPVPVVVPIKAKAELPVAEPVVIAPAAAATAPLPGSLIFPIPLPSPVPDRSGLNVRQQHPSSFGTPPGSDAALEKKPQDEKEEAVSVTIAARPTPVRVQTAQEKTAPAAEQPKQPESKWVAVTFNDGHLVMRNQGAFRQILVGQELPTGDVLKSINESTGDFTTSAGNFSINGVKKQ